MAAPSQSTNAPWATIDDICEPCSAYSFDEAVLARSLQVASDILFNLTGRQWPGAREETVRPCARWSDFDHGRPPGGYGLWSPSRSWLWGFCSCNRTERSGCSLIPEITLGTAAIGSVEQVKVDGVIVPPAQYRVDDYKWLVRVPDPADETDVNPGWPCCQDMTLADTEPGTFSVKFTHGLAPPVGGVASAATLACEIALSCSADSGASAKCRLPKRVTNITRQNVSMVVLDPLTLIKDGLTGIPEVDLWINSVNPKRIQRRATVLSPDIGRRIRRTGT